MRDTELLTQEFEPLQWSINEFWPEGAVLFGGPEKVKKSFMLYHAAACVATGHTFLNRFGVEVGDALYISLEDSYRRLRSRLQGIMDYFKMPEPSGRLHVYGAGDWPEAKEGGFKRLEEWLEDFPRARLIVIDPVAEFDPVPSTYIKGREMMMRYVELAKRHHVTIVLCNHMGKFASSTKGGVNGNGRSWRDAILGRAASAADVVQGLLADMTREPVEQAVLKTTGKDVTVGDLGLQWDERGVWTVQNAPGQPETADKLSAERKLVLAFLTAQGPSTAQEIADARQQTYDSAYHLLADMRSAGHAERINGYYMTPAQASELRVPSTDSPVQGELATATVQDAAKWFGGVQHGQR